ncbi:hypothetical protein ZWY2020_025669 [Hordeum vulgare]|nr:hypothetical protein ZWY2020_025669 [Hordeum vulgare]
MKLGCKVPDKLNGFVQVWFHHDGYDIKVEVERLLKRPRDRPAAPGPNNGPLRSVAHFPLGTRLDRGLGAGRRQVKMAKETREASQWSMQGRGDSVSG